MQAIAEEEGVETVVEASSSSTSARPAASSARSGGSAEVEFSVVAQDGSTEVRCNARGDVFKTGMSNPIGWDVQACFRSQFVTLYIVDVLFLI